MRRFFTICCLALLPLLLKAQISPNNGNYYVSYTDIEFPHSEQSITRSYNSTNVLPGLFGKGWSTSLQTQVYALPDGGLCVAWGGYPSDMMRPSELDQQGVYQMIDSIVENEIRGGSLQRTPSAIMSRRADLAVDHENRAQKYLRYAIDFNWPTLILEPGKKRNWKYHQNQIASWDGHQFTLDYFHIVYKFDSIGRQLYMNDGKDQLDIQHIKNGMEISANEKEPFHIYTDSSRHIRRITGKDSLGKPVNAFFDYDHKGQLTYSMDADSNQYWFEYDYKFNIVRTRYEDSSFRAIDYDPSTGRVIRFKEKNNSLSEYRYGYFFKPDGRINDDHYYTSVKNFDSLGKPSINQYYEYEHKPDETGDLYLYRSLIKTDTSYLENIYPPLVGNVSYRKMNEKEAWQRFDSKRRPVYLRMKDSVYLCTYNTQDLPARFVAIDSIKSDTVTYSYNYSANGALIGVFVNKTKYQLIGSAKQGKLSIRKGTQVFNIVYKNMKPTSFEFVSQPVIKMDELAKEENKEYQKLYQQLLDIIIPKKIQHEWIWDRL